MQVSTRSYLTAGMSFVAAGAIIATPMSPLAPKQEPSHRLVGDQQVHLAASTAPISIHNPAGSPQAVHVLADVSRAFQVVKAAKATTAIGGTSASPSVGRATVPRLAAAAAIPALAKAAQTSAATKQDTETADTPGDVGGQSLVPRSAAVNAFDPSGIENVLASAGQLLVDVNIAFPRRVLEATAVNFDDFLHDAAGHPFDLVGALSRFLTTEGESITKVGDVFSSVVGDDAGHLYSAIAAVFGVKPPDGGVMSAKTVIKPGATAASPVSGVVEKTTAKEQQDLDPGSKGVVTGKHSQDGSVRPAKVNASGQKGDTAPANQSGTEIKDQSPSNSTDATKGHATNADTTKDDTTKGDATAPNGQSTSTPTSHEHNGVSSTANGGTKDKGASKTKDSTHTASHKAGTGKHRATKGGHSGHGGHEGK
jgi:hypothetical protein